MWSEISARVRVCLDVFVRVIVRTRSRREADSKCHSVVWGQPSHTHSSCRRCCHPPPHCLCTGCLQSPSNTWRFHPPSVTRVLCLLLRLNKLSHRPSAPADSHLFYLRSRGSAQRDSQIETNTEKQWCTVCQTISFNLFLTNACSERPAKTEITWAATPDDRHSQVQSTSCTFGLQNETKVNKWHTEIHVLKFTCGYLYKKHTVPLEFPYFLHQYIENVIRFLKQDKRNFHFIYCGNVSNHSYLLVAEVCEAMFLVNVCEKLLITFMQKQRKST